LNFHCLGGRSTTYYPDYYGPMQGIDSGAPTDRLLVEWDLESPHVCALAAHLPPDPGFPVAEPANAVEMGRPIYPRAGLDGPQVLLRLPADFVQLSRENPALAVEWRMHTRALFLHYLSAGYTLTGFTRQGGPAYLLEK
jgi:chorismate synthase